MLPALSLGPLVLPVPALLLILGVYLGLTAVEKRANHAEVNPGGAVNALLIGLLVGLVVGRAAFVLRFPAPFLADPWQVLLPRPDLLDMQSALVAGLAAVWVYLSRNHGALWAYLDAFTPGLAVFAVSWWAASFASGQIFGSVTAVPWGIFLWGALRHPVQIYGLVAALGVLLVVFPVSKKWSFSPAGIRFLTFLALTAGIFLFVSTFRGDVTVFAGTLHVDQIIAWLVIATALAAIGGRIKSASVQGPPVEDRL